MEKKAMNRFPASLPKKQFYVGIDCGVKTGFAVWNTRDKQFSTIATVKIHNAMGCINELKTVYGFDFKVRIEDARLRKWIPAGKNEKEERGRREGAGSVKRDASIWEDFLTDLGIEFELVAPKNNKTKVTADYFKKLTGWDGVTSNHARDAAMLVFGY